MKVTKKIFALFICITLMTYSSLTTLAAFLCDHKLSGPGIKLAYYYIDIPSSNYFRTPYVNALTLWNKTKSNTGFNMKASATLSNAQIRCRIYEDKKNATTNGHAMFYIEPGTKGAKKTGLLSEGSIPTADWTYSISYMNTWALRNTSALFDNGVACHEIGHGIGLGHNMKVMVGGKPIASVMVPDGEGRWVTAPQPEDQTWLAKRYNFK